MKCGEEGAFKVSFTKNQATLTTDGIISLALECYGNSYTITDTAINVYFNSESDAKEFMAIYTLHLKKLPAKRKRKPGQSPNIF